MEHFKTCPFLKSLNIDGNKLTRFPDLKGVRKSLQYLDLSYNQISDILPITQSGIENILKFDISHNNIESLPELFKNIKIMAFLSLSNNRIKKIPAGILTTSSGLLQLFLQNNQIEVIEKGSFDGMTSLIDVFLFNNKLSSLPDDLFAGMSLQRLFLNGNELLNLTGRPFRGVKKSKTLIYLFSNRVHYIENKVFEDLGNQTTIALRCKSLVNLPLIDTNSLGKIICTPYHLPPIIHLQNNVGKALSESGFKCIEHMDDWECIICKAGTFGNGKKNTDCIECPAGGFYQEEMGQNHCKHCSNGTFVRPDNAPGQTPISCIACPKGTQSNKHAGYRACSCLGGFYRFDRFDRCMACPSKGLHCSNDYAVLAKGYFWTWTNLTSKQQYSDYINNLKIESDEFVKSEWKYKGTLPKPHRCLRESSCLGGLNSSCADGYRGPLCALCKTNFFGRMKRCIKCPSKVRAGLEIAGVIMAFVLILLILLWGDNRRTFDKRRTIADVIISCFKIVIGFYQVMAGLYTCFSNIEWPSSVVWIQKALRFVELSILEFAPLSCLSPKLSFNALQQFVVVLVSNAVVVLAILIYLTIRIQQHKCRRGADPKDIAERIAHTKRSCIRNICVFLFATYPKTCTSIIQVLSVNCIPLCSHDDSTHCTHYLRSDVSVQCHSPHYKFYSMVAYGLLMYPVGFPVVIGILIWYYVHKPSKRIINNRDIDMPQILDENPRVIAMVFDRDSRNAPFKAGLSVFHENYRPECWYWETFEIFRKLVLISGLTLIGEHSRTQIGLGVIISALFAILYVHFHPIDNWFENLLQTVALVATLINLCIGVMLKESDDILPQAVNQRNDKKGVSFLMIIINAAVTLIVIVSCLKIVVKRLYKWCQRFREVDHSHNRRSYCNCCEALGEFFHGLQEENERVNILQDNFQRIE